MKKNSEQRGFFISNPTTGKLFLQLMFVTCTYVQITSQNSPLVDNQLFDVK